MHKILIEEDYKASIENHRRLNLAIQKVLIKEVLKLLDAWINYLTSDNHWVSPVQVVTKK